MADHAQNLIPKHTYQWKSLTSPDSIRLFCLESAKDRLSPLYGTMKEVNLLGIAQPYEALSYACGAYNPSVKLYCDGPVYVLITETLASALRQFRLPDQNRLLWVDSVCIHQTDIPEKNHQVGTLVARIFQDATTVLGWLGAADKDTVRAFEIIHELSQHVNSIVGFATKDVVKEIPKTLRLQLGQKYLSNNSTADVIGSIFNRDWFNRRWILQEVILARDVIVQCGKHTLHWDTLVRASLALDVMQDQAFADGRAEKLAYIRIPFQSMMEYRLHRQDPKQFALKLHDDFQLVNLLHTFRMTQCRDRRDRVYALLRLSEDPFTMEVSYAESELSIFIRLTHHYLFDLQDLSILHWPNTGRIERSYVPDWNEGLVWRLVDLYGDVAFGNPQGKFCAGIGQSSLRLCEIHLSTSAKPVLAGWTTDAISCIHRPAGIAPLIQNARITKEHWLLMYLRHLEHRTLESLEPCEDVVSS